jgi:hypothetical protein
VMSEISGALVEHAVAQALRENPTPPPPNAG